MSIGDGTEPLLIMVEQQTESLKKKSLCVFQASVSNNSACLGRLD